MNRPDRLSRNQKKILKREEIRALYADSEYLNGFHTDQVKSVVFPKIQASERSKMNPLTPGETLERLIPASALIIVNRREAARQLEALRSLVEKATCWEWNLGEDLKGRPEATTSYLETKLDECSLL